MLLILKYKHLTVLNTSMLEGRIRAFKERTRLLSEVPPLSLKLDLSHHYFFFLPFFQISMERWQIAFVVLESKHWTECSSISNPNVYSTTSFQSGHIQSGLRRVLLLSKCDSQVPQTDSIWGILKQRFGPFFPCFLWSNVRVPIGMMTSSPLQNHSYQAELDFPFRRTLNTKFINKYIMEVVKK